VTNLAKQKNLFFFNSNYNCYSSVETTFFVFHDNQSIRNNTSNFIQQQQQMDENAAREFIKLNKEWLPMHIKLCLENKENDTNIKISTRPLIYEDIIMISIAVIHFHNKPKCGDADRMVTWFVKPTDKNGECGYEFIYEVFGWDSSEKYMQLHTRNYVIHASHMDKVVYFIDKSSLNVFKKCFKNMSLITDNYWDNGSDGWICNTNYQEEDTFTFLLYTSSWYSKNSKITYTKYTAQIEDIIQNNEDEFFNCVESGPFSTDILYENIFNSQCCPKEPNSKNLPELRAMNPTQISSKGGYMYRKLKKENDQDKSKTSVLKSYVDPQTRVSRLFSTFKFGFARYSDVGVGLRMMCYDDKESVISPILQTNEIIVTMVYKRRNIDTDKDWEIDIFNYPHGYGDYFSSWVAVIDKKSGKYLKLWNSPDFKFEGSVFYSSVIPRTCVHSLSL